VPLRLVSGGPGVPPVAPPPRFRSPPLFPPLLLDGPRPSFTHLAPTVSFPVRMVLKLHPRRGFALTQPRLCRELSLAFSTLSLPDILFFSFPSPCSRFSFFPTHTTVSALCPSFGLPSLAYRARPAQWPSRRFFFFPSHETVSVWHYPSCLFRGGPPKPPEPAVFCARRVPARRAFLPFRQLFFLFRTQGLPWFFTSFPPVSPSCWRTPNWLPFPFCFPIPFHSPRPTFFFPLVCCVRNACFSLYCCPRPQLTPFFDRLGQPGSRF